MIKICIPTTKERRPQLARLLESIYENTDGISYSILIYENWDGGWVPAVHNMLDGVEGLVVLLGSDVVVKKGWLQTLYNRFRETFPNEDGLAQPYDEINHGRLCQHPLGQASVIREYLHPGYIHNFSDNEMTDRLIADGKYLYVPEAQIEHLHWVNKKAEPDETYKAVMSSFEKDKQLYLARKQNGYKS